jgi:hypothetical protein
MGQLDDFGIDANDNYWDVQWYRMLEESVTRSERDERSATKSPKQNTK